MIESLTEQLKERRQGHKRSKALRIKKLYKKDKQCSHENCNKKYSSQIALNAHIKKVHRKPEDSEEYVL
jgi:3-deoxy-D-arabino-heptulosonate 7-phosphate (DAHP) synthase